MSLVSNDEIYEEFETFSISITDDDVFNQLRGFCETYSLSAESLVEHWLAFSTQKKLKISLETLDLFERDRLLKLNIMKTPTGVKIKSKINTLLSDYDKKNNESINFLCSYDDSVNTKKRHLSTPDNDSKRRMMSITESPMFSLTPACLTPSEKFQCRTNSCEIILKYGLEIQDIPICIDKVDLSLFDVHQCIAGAKYMFQRLVDRVGVLSDRVIDHGEEFIKKEICELNADKDIQNQNVTIVGRVRAEMDQKLTTNNVFLDHPDFRNPIALDVTNLSNFSLFSGQILCVEGSNPSGRIFHATKIIETLTDKIVDSNICIEDTNILVACGPFSTSDNLLYEPMGELLNKIQQYKPNICILCGPFIDQKQVENEEYMVVDLTLIFESLLNDIMQVCKSNGVNLIIQPSQRDFLHDFVYPQPPFRFSKNQDNVKLISDPCTMKINNNLIVGITSTDILLHMSADEIASSNHHLDRISRLINHLITQCSYYPLLPHSLDVNIDYELFEVCGQMPTTPHILILPSDLRFFIKKIGEVVCINPGRLARGQIGGTYAKIFLRNGQITSHIIRI